jgi:hypothetical protein
MAVPESQQYNLTDQTNNFKIFYYKRSANMYNSDNVLQGRIRKKYDFTGKQKFVNTPLSFSGGVGASKLPKANAGNYSGAIITAKKVYATTEIEREAIKASANNKGAFVQATKESVKKAVESYMRFSSFILFGDGSGVLGQGDASGVNVSGNGSVGTPYVVEIPAAFWNEAHWEEKDYVQMVTAYSGVGTGTAEGGDAITNLLEVVAVDPTNRLISLVGTSARLGTLSGAGPLAATDAICMQRSLNAVPQGLKGIKDVSVAGTGSMYNIPYARRWSMYVLAAGGSGIGTDLMNQVLLQTKKRSGKTPNMIVTSFEQFQSILALLEDHKRYEMPNRNLKGALSFPGVEFMSTEGPVGIFADRFCESDEMWFLSDDAIECHHRPGFGWFDDDGTVFLRKADEDNYEARYGGYYENFITPTFHGCLTGLAV